MKILLENLKRSSQLDHVTNCKLDVRTRAHTIKLHSGTSKLRPKPQNHDKCASEISKQLFFFKILISSEVDFGQLFFGDGLELATSTGDTKDPGPDVAERVTGMMAHQRMVLEWKLVCEGLGWEG